MKRSAVQEYPEVRRGEKRVSFPVSETFEPNNYPPGYSLAK
jgi:hypothetical protein